MSHTIKTDDEIEKFITLEKDPSGNLYYEKYKAKIYDYCVLSQDAQFDKVYLVSGLRRSGNHLLLQTIFCSCPDNSVLFINDFPSLFGVEYDDTHIENQFNVFERVGMFRKSLATISYTDSGKFKCGSESTNKLIEDENINNLKEITKEWKDRKKILIFSLEDQQIKSMDRIANIFKNRANNIYKIIAIRDVINCFSSRIKAHCDRKKLYANLNSDTIDYKVSQTIREKGGLFVTNMDTLGIWLNYFEARNNQEYIIFNYNKIIKDDKEKIKLCKKLNIVYNPKFFEEKSTFGKGSSFAPATSEIDKSSTLSQDDKKSLSKRFSGIEYCEEEHKVVIDTIIRYNELVRDVCDYFSLELTDKDKEDILKIVEQKGGYYKKYLKYKNKYLQLKNNIKL